MTSCSYSLNIFIYRVKMQLNDVLMGETTGCLKTYGNTNYQIKK